MLPAILLVDDDPTTNFLSTRLLNRLGASEEVLVALNGAAALQLLQQRCPATAGVACPALVLLDVNMPVMGGFEFLEAYQQLPAAKRQRTVIVMLTTSMLAADRQRAEQLSVSGFLTKPLTRAKLAAVFGQHFGLALPAA
ncbi:response regulator [Hymenobacter psychrophilus]|uniref:Response regulator receiver domain-containing protein n=1 Tax=Hymenobacter psychrophilus TaxID=651662 RepID=A0A1H3CSZ2_9BACT|nr:response regulator [Hymenobacter psychrophilus]SDX57257.1 Response regulator receiver domain-containing protein [Hymenobacter psychrophilus]